MKIKLVLLLLLNLLTLSFGIFSFCFTLNSQFQHQNQGFLTFTLGSSIIFPLSVLFVTLEYLSHHSDDLSCSCMIWSLLKFITITFSLAWYGFALNLYFKLMPEFPPLHTYGWITLTYFLIYSIIWTFGSCFLASMCLYLAIKQTEFRCGFWIMFFLFTIPLVTSAVQIKNLHPYYTQFNYTSLSILSTVFVLLSLLTSYLQIRFYTTLPQHASISCAQSYFQFLHFFYLPFQGFLIVISFIWDLSAHNIFQTDQKFANVLSFFAFLMGMIAIFANPVRYHYLYKFILQYLDFEEGLIYFQKLLNQAMRGINLSSGMFLLLRWTGSSVEISFFLFTLIAFTIIKSLIQAKKISLLKNYQDHESEYLNRFYKVLTIGIIYAQFLETMFCGIFYGFLGSFEILIMLSIQTYFLLFLIPQAVYFTSLEFAKLNLPEQEILLDQQNLELQEIEADVDFDSILEDITQGEVEIAQCCICCQQMGKQSVSRITQCGHSFHTACIKNWLQTKPNCPIDRRKV